jgi:nucleoside-diphosphate-sugar epimerase
MTKVLITGGTGFIGSFLGPHLKELGYEVFNVEQYFWSCLGSGKELIADVNDVYALTRILRKIQPDIIIHLAASTAVAYSYDHPHEVVSVNLMGTLNLAEVARVECPKLKQFICPSSAEVYGNNGISIKKENSVLAPGSPYAVSKEAVERYLMYLYEAYQFPFTIFRPFNSYGRLDSHWFVVEKTIYQMLNSSKINLGDPEPVRDFLYIQDHVDAYVKALENPRAIGEIFNLCTGIGIKISELVERISDIIGWKGEVVWHTMPRRPSDVLHLVGSNKKLLDILKCKEPISLGEGLQKTVEKWRDKLCKES